MIESAILIFVLFLVPGAALINAEIAREEKFGRKRISKKNILGILISFIPVANWVFILFDALGYCEVWESLILRKQQIKKSIKRINNLRKYPQFAVSEQVVAVVGFYSDIKSEHQHNVDKLKNILNKSIYVRDNFKKLEVKDILLKNEMMIAYLDSLIKEHPELLQDGESELFEKMEKLVYKFIAQVNRLVEQERRQKAALKVDLEETVKNRVMADLDVILETTDLLLEREK